jgi:hypothetical protein
MLFVSGCLRDAVEALYIKPGLIALCLRKVCGDTGSYQRSNPFYYGFYMISGSR